MSHMNNLKLSSVKSMVNIDDLELTTKEEDLFHSVYIKKLMGFCSGEVSGMEIKQLIAASATIAKKQQSRSAVLALTIHINNHINDNMTIEPQQIDFKKKVS